MDPACQGYYVNLISQQWIHMESGNGAGLPGDVEALASLARARNHRAFASAWRAHLQSLFPEVAGGQRLNPTLAEIWHRQHTRIEAQSEGGKRGADSRYGPLAERGHRGGGLLPANANEVPNCTPSLRAFDFTSDDATTKPDPRVRARVLRARLWLKRAPRSVADKVRAELKRRLPFPDDWDLRRLPKTAMQARDEALVAILTDMEVDLDGTSKSD
jgi:hypothetical protein